MPLALDGNNFSFASTILEGALPYFGRALPRNKLYLNKALAFLLGSLRSLEEGDRNVCSKINVDGACIDDAGCM